MAWLSDQECKVKVKPTEGWGAFKACLEHAQDVILSIQDDSIDDYIPQFLDPINNSTEVFKQRPFTQNVIRMEVTFAKERSA